jgi:indole-3-glycerol phosphate synthase
MTGILDKIVEAKVESLEESKAEVSHAVMIERASKVPPPLNFSGYLLGDGVRLIAEVKRASPSRGLLRQDFDPGSLGKTYAQNGAAAVSVLTEGPHFQGSLAHLWIVKQTVESYKVPVLRKDFIFDDYQIWESKRYRADAVLLIVAILTPDRLMGLLALCQKLWLQCLVEVHDEEELKIALDAGAEIIGINNRDLQTFQTDLSVTERLLPLIPPGKVVVSESGINSHEVALQLKRQGVHAVLVGEALVTASDVGSKVRNIVGNSD